MDVWSREPQRRKRSHAEMSNATLSPSPFNFRDRASSFLNNSFLAGSPSESLPPSFLDRRRTSHPHNQPLYEMPDRSQSQLRPSLMHQASQTIIDLTEEPETPPNVQQNPRQRSRPPQLGRSDALGFGDLIDLTDDNEPDLIITGGRELPPLPRNAARQTAPQRREDSPSLFMPLPPPPNVRRVFAAHHNGVGIVIGDRMEGSGAPLHMHGNFHIERMANDIMDHFHFFQQEHPPQAMPGRMDYQSNAFAQRKAEHVPPPPARQDFTRSPKEDDIIICPSCEQELVHRKDGEEPVTKKGGKAPTRKEREEHPFWVLKECGHVYCNNCYQNRTSAGKPQSTVSFQEKSKSSTARGKSTTALICAVEDCESEVKNKDKWVGVFL